MIDPLTISAAFKGLSLGRKVLSAAFPILLILAVPLWGHLRFKAGENSRDAEVKTLTGKIADLTLDVGQAQLDLATMTILRDNLQGEVTALTREKLAALEARDKALDKVSEVSANALREIANSRVDLSEFFKQLEEDAKNAKAEIIDGRCVVRGGGSILLNAAAGKSAG